LGIAPILLRGQTREWLWDAYTLEPLTWWYFAGRERPYRSGGVAIVGLIPIEFQRPGHQEHNMKDLRTSLLMQSINW
jgi:hypothetical protein